MTLSELDFRPLTPALMDALETIFKGTWGRSCWCMHPRLTDAQMRALPGEGKAKDRRRAALEQLARRPTAPGVLAYQGREPVGWVAVAPRGEYARVDGSRATPRVDEENVWVIACIAVRKDYRGSGVAVKLIQAAAAYAIENGAPAVEAYPRAGTQWTGDDNAYFGTEPMFKRAGFDVVRGQLENLPRNWTPRVTMRLRPTNATNVHVSA
ncbi:MAG: GNAT family N-acetyltransferase [Pseudomonadota bacterium]